MSDDQPKEKKDNSFFRKILSGWSDDSQVGQSRNARGRTFDNIKNILKEADNTPGHGEKKGLIEPGEIEYVSKRITDEVTKIGAWRVPNIINDIKRDIDRASNDFAKSKDETYTDKTTGMVFTREAFKDFLDAMRKGTNTNSHDFSQVTTPKTPSSNQGHEIG